MPFPWKATCRSGSGRSSPNAPPCSSSTFRRATTTTRYARGSRNTDTSTTASGTLRSRNGQRLIAACRSAGIEVVYTVVECLTKDGRDRGLDYKISGIFAAKGSWEAEVIDELGPGDDDIIIPKTSSSLFNSTNCEYVLRNLGIEYVMVMGMLTDQCVETAVRDGCDRGFLMTLVDDACATHSDERHREALQGFKGYCRIRTTAELLEELGHLRPARPAAVSA